MTDTFIKLSNTDLRELISALKSGRVSSPYSELQVARALSPSLSIAISAELHILGALGFSENQIIATLELLHRDRVAQKQTELSIDLVTSGPEAPGVNNRDTGVVVHDLFTHATKSVMVVGYVVYQGQRVFEALASRMQDIPELDVEMFIDIARAKGDTTASEILVSRYAQRFRDSQWPANIRLPKVFYDPRSLNTENTTRSSLHAKCIVIDNTTVFVSSANFTQAAQQRNIEVGLLIHSTWLAECLTRHFKLLHNHDLIARAF